MNSKEQDHSERLRYANLVLESRRWINSAIDLHDTVKTLEPVVRNRWKDFNDFSIPAKSLMIHKTFFLLIGLTVGNLLKSRIVKYNKKLLRSEILKNGKLPTKLKGNHDLIKFAEYANMKITDEQRELLRRLTRAIRWSGRYAFPPSYKEFSFDDYSMNDIDEMKQFLSDIFVCLHIQQK
jgi:hypothetical protein